MNTKETILKEELSETKTSLKIVESLVSEYFELKEFPFSLTSDQYVRKLEVEQKLKELCLPKKTNNNSKKD